MGLRHRLLLSVLGVAAPCVVHAQTVINLSTLPSASGAGVNGSTVQDVSNTATAVSIGAIGSAGSVLQQDAANSQNVVGLPGGTPVALGNGLSVTLNMLAAAGYTQSDGQATTSLSTGNTNAAVANGINVIPGGPATGYGAQQGSAAAGGSQSGTNTLNAASIAVAATTAVSLSQMPAVVGPSGGFIEPTASSLATALPTLYGPTVASPTDGSVTVFDPTYATAPVQPNLNLSVVNTLLGYSAAGPASAGGSTAAGSGNQTATNAFNTASIAGGQSVTAQQLADFPSVAAAAGAVPWSVLPTTAVMQSINTAAAFDGQLSNANVSGGAVPAADLTTVANLAQSANTVINTLNLAPGGVAGNSAGSVAGNSAGSIALSGLQSGSLPWVISTNQAVASNGIGADANGIVSNGVLLSASGSASWAGLAGSLGTPGLPAPGSVASAAALPASASASLSNVSQSLGLGLNAVNVQGGLQSGPAGFSQSVGSMALASSVLNDATSGWSVVGPVVPYANFAPSALNAGIAVGAAGSASLTGVTQAGQISGNTISGSANVGGALSQSVGLIDYAAAGLVPALSQSSLYPGLTPNAGAAVQQGAPGSLAYGPLIASPGAIGAGAAINGATALLTGPGKVALAQVGQSASGVFNTLQANGAISSGASGTITQQIGQLANYGGTLNKQIAMVAGAGTANVLDPTQALSMVGNAIVAGGAISGAIAQTAPATPATGAPVQPANAIEAVATTSGGASVVAASGGAATQSSQQTLNLIASGSTLGTPSATASIAQSAPAISYVIDGVATAPVNGIQANAWRPNDPSGLITNAQISGASQLASLAINAMSAPSGGTGVIAQTSGGLLSSTANAQSAISGLCNTCQLAELAPRFASGSGNSQIVNAAQSNTQSLNTSTFGGSVAGTVTIALSGATSLSTSNLLNGTANLGNSKVSGTQVAANLVSVMGSGH